ncbi:alpha/beta hydrolase domain-containing protein [soil metagenome]
MTTSPSTAQTGGLATITGPVPGRPALTLTAFDLADVGYRVDEYFLSGPAVSYKAAGANGRDGHWFARPDRTAEYRTRMVVVRPEQAEAFNGTIVVEWLNVSAGADTAPEWGYTHRELIRSGYAWVGVSVQKAGIDGGGMMAFPGMEALRKSDPGRYGDLIHPGDAFCYDIFTQAARAIRAEPQRLIGVPTVKTLIAAGESQSAGRLTTYINAIAPLGQAFDGYLVHSRFGGAPGIGKSSLLMSLLTALKPVRLRTDTTVPVLNFITETDLMTKRFGYLPARQPDHARLRTWEVAGTAHADTYVMGASPIDSGNATAAAMAEAIAPTCNLLGITLPGEINAAPQHHYVMMAALSALNRWITNGEAPHAGTRLDVGVSKPATLVLDAAGNATGGIRSPWMDAPTCRLSGLAVVKSRMGGLFGSTTPLAEGDLTRLYTGGRDDYLAAFGTALSSTIAAGFILASDRSDIEALAAASYPDSRPPVDQPAA